MHGNRGTAGGGAYSPVATEQHDAVGLLLVVSEWQGHSVIR